MTLLEDIQKSAVDGDGDLSSLLRKCKLLAARLGSKPLEDWLLWESDGYPAEATVPEYRIWSLEVKGHFLGPFGSGINNAPIPRVCLPKKSREFYEAYRCRQSVAAVEDIVRKAGKENHGGTVTVSTGDLAILLGTNVYRGQNCIQTWAEFSIGNLVELLNAVRNRVLDFSIAVWKEAPQAGEEPRTSAIESRRVTQIFNTVVHGSANLVGHAQDSAISFGIQPHDFAAISRVLKENGIPALDVDELKAALDADPIPEEPGKLGPRVSAWIAGVMGKVAAGGAAVGVGAAGNLVSQLIAKYYGIG